MEKTDCFAYRKRRGDGASLCVALTRCYCVEEDCPFLHDEMRAGQEGGKGNGKERRGRH